MKFLSTNEISQVGGGYNACYEQVTCQYFVGETRGGSDITNLSSYSTYTYTLAAGNSKLCPGSYAPKTLSTKDLREVRTVTNNMKRDGDNVTTDTVLSATYLVNICK